jgi:hypothetical protein
MCPENPSWILVEGSSAGAIQKAVTEHAGLTKHVVPSTHRVLVYRLDGKGYGVLFEPPIPPYAFTNLIGWLDDPRMTPGAVRAVGWLIAPGDGTRYFLTSQRANAGGDTLVGVSDEGIGVSVFLPDCRVSHGSGRISPTPEPTLPLQGVPPVALFEITVDSDRSFGNPEFAAG